MPVDPLRIAIATLALVFVVSTAPASAQWAGLTDASDALMTDRFAFSGPNGDPLYAFGNENYYDGDFADIDGDGLPDRSLGARYGLLLNTGGGYMTFFAGRTGFLFRGMSGASGWGEDSFQFLDADNDGDYDCLSGGNNEPWVLQSNAAGRWSISHNIRMSTSSVTQMALTDIERDGDVDVMLCDGGFAYNFALWVNDGTGSFSEQAVARGLPYAGGGVSNMVSGDVDGDGDFDIILAPAERYMTGPEKVMHVLLNDGTGNYTHTSTINFAEGYTECCPGVGSFSQSMNLGDIDDDGDLDLVTARGPWPLQGDHPDVSHSIFINDGTGVFTDESATRWDIAGFDPSVYAQGKIGGGDGKLVDIDYDGDLDFVAHARNDGRFNLWLNDGTGNFTYNDSSSFHWPMSGMGLGGDCDVTDLDGDGDYDVWLGAGGGRVRTLLNDHTDPSGLPADVPRNLTVESAAAGAVVLRWEHPPFASSSRYYRVYRATAAGLEDRDRRRLHVVGIDHQDETFGAAITRHTTTEWLGDPDVVLDGAANAVEYTDRTAEEGVTYRYTVSHVAHENVESAQTAEVTAVVGTPDPAGDSTPPTIDILAPTTQDWSPHPRIVVHWSDGGSGVDPSTSSVSFDRDAGSRAAGEDLSDLAYRRDAGVIVIPLEPPVSLADGQLVTMTVSVDDVAGNTATETVRFFVATSASTHPTASIDASPTSGDAPLTVSFDGSGSTDDGTIYRWEWYFGDGSTAIGRQVDHVFGAGGSYDVTLLVRDDDGGVGSASRTIDVSGAPPECTTGETRACYSGPAGTDSVGACRAGTESCEGLLWGACAGEVTPASEVCDDGIDNDCDGAADDADSEGCGAPGEDAGLPVPGRDGGTTPPPPDSDDGCGCVVPGGAPSSGGWLVLCVLLLSIPRLRRRR